MSQRSEHRRPWRFSLRMLLAAVGAVAVVLGVFIAWPKPIHSLKIPRYSVRPNNPLRNSTRRTPGARKVGTAFEVKFVRRWSRVSIDILPREGLGDVERAELMWLENGRLRRIQIGKEGVVSAGRIPVRAEWPLVFCVVQYHPRMVAISGPSSFSENGSILVSSHSIRGSDAIDLKAGIVPVARRWLQQLRRQISAPPDTAIGSAQPDQH